MASYHLSVKTIKRSAGRSATAAAAYRAGARIECQREGRVHDYTRKNGVEESFILTPEGAPSWAEERAALWNAAEDRETRCNSVTAREWELALPSEISAEDRSEITRAFAQTLVERYSVAVDVAIHAPHREGDQRNHHAHVLTSTRRLDAEGFTDKTRVLDAAKTGGVEIEAMREVWGQLQNWALERAGLEARVDHRSLEMQREEALSRGDEGAAEALDRDPEVKLGPAANAMERREQRAAAAEGRDYEPVTERGRVVHAIRQQRDLLADLRDRAERAREAYIVAREQEAGRFSAAVDAAKALFAPPGGDEFAAGFTEAWSAQEEARQRELAEERERVRQQDLADQRDAFVEGVAQAWEATWQIRDPEQAKDQQSRIVDQVRRGADTFETSFDVLAGAIDTRASEIQEHRVEQERQEELEREQQRQAARDRSSDYGYGL